MGEAMIQSPVSPYLNSLFSIYFVKPLFFFFFHEKGNACYPKESFCGSNDTDRNPLQIGI